MLRRFLFQIITHINKLLQCIFCYLRDPLQLFFTGGEQGSLWVLKKPRERCRHPGQKQPRGPWYLPSQAGSDPMFPPALSRRFRAESGFTENKSGISSSFVFVVSCLSAVSSLGDRKTSIPAVSVGKKTLSVIYISGFYWVFTAVLNHLVFL